MFLFFEILIEDSLCVNMLVNLLIIRLLWSGRDFMKEKLNLDVICIILFLKIRRCGKYFYFNGVGLLELFVRVVMLVNFFFC